MFSAIAGYTARLVPCVIRSYARTTTREPSRLGGELKQVAAKKDNMRLLVVVSVVWFVLSLVVGGMGRYTLHGQWKRAEDEKLASSAGLVASICADTDWEQPWEEDKRWGLLESQWSVDVVPIWLDIADGRRGQVVDRSDNALEANQWTQLHSGSWRVARSVLVDRSGKNDAQAIVGVQVTRVVSDSSLSTLWWTLWGITNLLALCLIGWAVYAFRKLKAVRQVAIKPWVAAANQVTDSSTARLPVPSGEPNEYDADLQMQMSMLRDAVNGWLSELQSSLQRNEFVLGNMQEGVLAVDSSGRVLLVNATLIRMLDITVENYLYRSLVEVIRTPRIIAIVERVLKSSTSQEDSFEHGPANLSLRLMVRPVQLGDGQVGALMTVRDETLLKRVESVRRDFVTNASHELKTPLAAIRAYAETLQMGATEDPEATQSFLAGILTQTDRINGLITGMLQLARVQSGNVTLKRVQIDMRLQVESCLDSADVMARSKQIQLQSFLPSEPLLMQSDPEAVQTIVSNLLSNAVRYTPSGGSVTLHLERHATGAWIAVRDTGVGIEKEELSRIFERFYRVERSRTLDAGGTGLGLSIVKHLVQALGGTIMVKSEPQKGSSFEVHLPFSPP